MIHVQEINRLDELARCRLTWNCLLRQTRGATFFHSLDWMEVYWRHFGGEQNLRVLLVSSGDRALGILPLVVRTESTKAGPLRVLTYPLHDWSAFYGPIGPNPTATLLVGLKWLRANPRDWDLLDLRWTDADGQDHGRTEQAMRMADFEPVKSVASESSQIDLTIGWKGYWASRKSQWRNNVRRCEKKLAERGTVTFVRYRPLGRACGDGDPRWDLYEACERIARNSWQADSSTGTTLIHPEVRSFFRDAHARAAEAGAVDLNLLLLDNTPVAFSYNYHFQGYLSGVRMGFDHAASRDGAGTVLQHRILQDSFERGDHTYDMGAGYLECKRYWQTCLRKSYRYTHYPLLSVRAQIRHLKHWLTSPRPLSRRKTG